MLIFVKGILDIAMHAQVHMCVLIIQFQSDATVELASPIFLNGVVCCCCINEMLGMFFSEILYTKIIHDKGELYGESNMAPYTWCELGLMVATRARWRASSWLARMPAWGRPYMHVYS
jgi:hypothetical protein